MHLSVKHFKKAQILYSSAKPGFVFTTETYFEHHPACIASSTLPTFGLLLSPGLPPNTKY